MSDRIDGHLVSGHIDGIGTIDRKETSANSILLRISVATELTRYMIIKGSIAVDGISLTINALENERFDVSIIPHTASMTTLAAKAVGDFVNIETDMLAKYVERFVSGTRNQTDKTDRSDKSIDMTFLAESGFL